MQRFTELMRNLSSANRAESARASIIAYLDVAPEEDATWAVYLLTQFHGPRWLSMAQLRAWVAAETGLPDWLIAACHRSIRDECAALSLMLPEPAASQRLGLRQIMEERVLPLSDLPLEDQQSLIRQTWRELPAEQRHWFNRWLTRRWRKPRHQSTLIACLAERWDVFEAALACRLLQPWTPQQRSLTSLMQECQGDQAMPGLMRPMPFQEVLPWPEAEPLKLLGDCADWLCLEHWHGPRMQLIRLRDHVVGWTEQGAWLVDLPDEIQRPAKNLPEGSILLGTMTAWNRDQSLPVDPARMRVEPAFDVQADMKPKPRSRQARTSSWVYMVHDLLALEQQDLCDQPLATRRALLDQCLGSIGETAGLRHSRVVPLREWREAEAYLEQARGSGLAALRLLRLPAASLPTPAGTRDWLLRLPALRFRGVLMQAHAVNGSNRGKIERLSLGVWQNAQLVPAAHVAPDLPAEDLSMIAQFVRENTVERFGPVCVLKPQLVFEFACDAVVPSRRHKAGFQLLRPRLVRYCVDAEPNAAHHVAQMTERMIPVNAAKETPLRPRVERGLFDEM